MRVLLTVPSLDSSFGGPPVVARSLRAALRALGHEVDVAGCGDAPDAVGLPSLGRFRGTPVPRRTGPILRAIERVDVVHVLGYRDPVGTMAALAARRRGIPYLVEPMGMHRRRLRSHALKASFDGMFGRGILRHAFAIVATSRIEADELARDGVPPRRILLRANGVARSGLAPSPARGALRARLGLSPDMPLILALGRIAAKKGLLDLLAAVEALPGAAILIAGPDDRDGTMKALERSGARLARAHRLFVLPHGLWGRGKEEALVDADAFCLPSATENFGIAAAEAAVAGLPVVVSDRCGVAEWLDSEAARVVPFGQVETLAAALRDAVWNPGVRAAARAAAPRIARALDWAILARHQAEIYREAVEAIRSHRESPVGPGPHRDRSPTPVPRLPHPSTLKRLERGAD